MGHHPTIENTLILATLKGLVFDPDEEEAIAIGETPVGEIHINLHELRKNEARHLLAEVFSDADIAKIEAFERLHLTDLT